MGESCSGKGVRCRRSNGDREESRGGVGGGDCSGRCDGDDPTPMLSTVLFPPLSY